jgi:hypothetical protein
MQSSSTVTCTFFIFLSDGDDYWTIKLKVAATEIASVAHLAAIHLRCYPALLSHISLFFVWFAFF